MRTTPGRIGGPCRLAAVLSVLLVPACDAVPEDAAVASTLTILGGRDDARTTRESGTKYLLFLPLVHGEGADVTPRLAESWEHSADYRTWTFHLRNDVRWHDGVPVTAHDVAFSLELFEHPDVQFAARMWGIDSLEVLDDHTFTIVLERDFWVDPRAAWPVFFPKHLLENLDPAEFYEWDFWTRPVGNGPYRFVRHVPRTMFELEANPDFYAGEPSIERVIVKLGGSNPVAELRSGESDVAFGLRPNQLLALRDDPRFVVYHQYNWDELYLIYWNHGHHFLGEVAVRRALNHAIDRRELAELLAFPDDVPLVAGLGNEKAADPEGRRGWDRIPMYDPESASRLLEEAGWIDRDGDGIREKAGRPARFSLLAPGNEPLGGVTQGLLLADQLQQVGVAVDIRPVESYGIVREAIESGDFDAATVWEDQDSHTILWAWFGGPAAPRAGETGNDRVRFGYHDAEAVQLLEALLTEGTPRAQDTLFTRLNEIIRRDAPVMILFPGVYNHAVSRRIRGFRQGWPSALTYAEELSIEPDRRVSSDDRR